MKNIRSILSIATITFGLSMVAESVSALSARNVYQEYLSSLRNCAPEAIRSQSINRCRNTVSQAIEWANSIEGIEYINSCNNKRTKFIYSVQQANSGIASIQK